MKKIIIIACLVIAGAAMPLRSAEKLQPDFLMALDTSYTLYDKYKPTFAAGLEFEFFPVPWLSFNCRLIYGKGFMHMPLTAYIFRETLANSSGSDNEWWGVLLVSEGISFHFWVDEGLDLSLVANPGGYEYLGRSIWKEGRLDPGSSRWVISGSFGVKVSTYWETFMLGMLVEYRTVYNNGAQGVGVSLNAGVWF